MSTQNDDPGFVSRPLSRRSLLAGAGASLVGLAGCEGGGGMAAQIAASEAINVATTYMMTDLELSEQDEINIGTRLYPQIIAANGGRYRNRKVQAAIEQFADPLFRSGKRGHLPWEIVVLDADTVNAWALPGGKVGVNKGLLRYVSSDDELAAVISHEVGHAELGHMVKELRTERLSDALEDSAKRMLQRAVPDPSGGFLTGQAIDLMAPAIHAIVVTGYSRESELEADAHILYVFELAGYDPLQAPGFFRTLLQLYPEGAKGTTSLFSTHPGTRDRIAALQEAAAQAPAPTLPPASRGYAEIKATFPTRQYFRRHPVSSV